MIWKETGVGPCAVREHSFSVWWALRSKLVAELAQGFLPSGFE